MRSNAKTQAVKEALKVNPSLSNREISELVGCHITYVHQLRKKLMTKGKIAHAKVKAKNKGGRPTKVAIEANSLTQACDVIGKLVKEVKDLCFAFDTSKDKVEIIWREDLYDVPSSEVPQAIACIKYLQSMEKQFS